MDAITILNELVAIKELGEEIRRRKQRRPSPIMRSFEENRELNALMRDHRLRRAKAWDEARALLEAPAAPALAVQALAGEIIAALLADEKEGYDLEAGLFGPAFSALVRRWTAAEWALAANPHLDRRNTDYKINPGDIVTSPTWDMTELKVIDVNWAMRSAAVQLGPKGGIVVWSVAGLARTGERGWK